MMPITLPDGIEHRLIGRIKATAEQHRRPLVGLATAKNGLSGMIGSKLGADCAVAVFFLHVGGAANKLLRRIVVDKERGVAAYVGDRPIDDPVVAEFGHLGDFDAGNDPVAKADLGVRIGLAECESECAKAKVDVALGADIEVTAQRPIARAYQKRSIDRDQ